eukprot:gnl/Hemi2/20794_TR6886_c0_g1_i1.p1 gnl/Hemi2/20794_TR6886_c0_g1~~gnl/Hemi2/20794_TR6886_c0_g1_i1.p1  ORF type:complete len:454 (+),score=94.35 gnl/Hemi2/20794_TR6886_c0_g1_i1:47-1363(+)
MVMLGRLATILIVGSLGLVMLLGVVGVDAATAATTTSSALPPPLTNNPDVVLTRIAFGSCNRHDFPAPVWDSIVATKPDLWIWLGDAIYADTKHSTFVWRPSPVSVMKEKYALQKAVPGYKNLIARVPVLGVWDDHDYGMNNGGNNYGDRAMSQAIYLDFLGEHPDSVRRQREGIYGSYTFGPPGKRVKLILLDTRYFRDPISNGEGDILGEEQWNWFSQQLQDLATEEVSLLLIGSGIQVTPTDKPISEKWGNFRAARARFFAEIQKANIPAPVVLLSGDVHYSEMFKCTLDRGDGHTTVHEVTSSGLTHSCTDNAPLGLCRVILHLVMKSRFNHQGFSTGKGFGLIDIGWEEGLVHLQIRAEDGEIVLADKISLQPSTSGTPGHLCQGHVTPLWMVWELDTWVRLGKFCFVALLLACVALLLWWWRWKRSHSYKSR